MSRRTLEDRFFAKVEKADACWLWRGATINGYGRFAIRRGKIIGAHRWSYEFHIGPIPDGLELDHLCRVRNCINPAHLEPVTHAVNMARRPSSTHCPAGHEFTEANTYLQRRKPGQRPGRLCRACNAARARKRRGVSA